MKRANSLLVESRVWRLRVDGSRDIFRATVRFFFFLFRATSRDSLSFARRFRRTIAILHAEIRPYTNAKDRAVPDERNGIVHGE